MDLVVESALRVAIMDWVRKRAEVTGRFLHRQELLDFSLDGCDRTRYGVVSSTSRAGIQG